MNRLALQQYPRTQLIPNGVTPGIIQVEAEAPIPIGYEELASLNMILETSVEHRVSSFVPMLLRENVYLN